MSKDSISAAMRLSVVVTMLSKIRAILCRKCRRTCACSEVRQELG